MTLMNDDLKTGWDIGMRELGSSELDTIDGGISSNPGWIPDLSACPPPPPPGGPEDPPILDWWMVCRR